MKRTLWIFLVVVTLLIGALVLADLQPLDYYQPGTRDFVQYWAAFRLLTNGQNPYDANLQANLQQSVGRKPPPVLMWNPPWILLLLAPVLCLPFGQAAALWMEINLGFLLLTTYCCWRLHSSQPIRPQMLLFSALFYPSLHTFYDGQLSLMFAACLALFLLAVSTGRDFVAGALLVPLTVKPHLFYLLAVLLLYWLWRTRRLRVLYGCLCGSAVLLLALLIYAPGVLPAWWTAVAGPHQPGLGLVDWHVATLAGFLRGALQPLMPASASLWLSGVIPAATGLCFLIVLLRFRPQVDLRWMLPLVLGISLFTSPYGWISDQAALLVPYACMHALVWHESVSRRKRACCIAVLIGLQCLAILLQHVILESIQGHLFWFPAALTLTWLGLVTRLRSSSIDRAHEAHRNNPQPFQ